MLSRRALGAFLILSLVLVLHAPRGLAQGEPSRFQPPPPPLGIPDEVGDEEIEEIEGDAPVRPPTFPGGMPGMPGGGANAGMPAMPSAPPPPPTVRGTPNTFVKTGKDNANGIRFQVVDGEFFEKGKRRGRITDTRKPITQPTNRDF